MQIKLFFKGFIIGLGKIIPGVSGALFACLFGVYELIIECLSSPSIIIKKFNRVLPLGIGIVFAIIFGSNIIKYLLINYYVNSMSFFIGVLTFSIIPLINKSIKTKHKFKDYFIASVLTILIASLLLIDFSENLRVEENYLREFISLILCGFIDAGSTIIPGISGSALLMIFGYYEIVITALAVLDLKVLTPFLIGFILGLVLIAKLINYLFKNYKDVVDLSIMTFAMFSIIYLSINTFFSLTKLTIEPIIPFITGFILSYIMEKKIN